MGDRRTVQLLTLAASCIIHVAAGLSAASDCPLWGENCTCGNDIGGIVLCDAETKKVSVAFGYCMTPKNDSDSNEGMIVGMCPLANLNKSMYLTMMPGISVCSNYSRDGQLCGSCVDGTGVSYTLTDYEACHNCSSDTRTQAEVWLVFLAIQILPPTVMFFFIVFARIRASSPHLNSVVFFCQMMAYPKPLGTISYAADVSPKYTEYLYLLYNLWSMLFVLPIGWYSNFNYCLHPRITFLPALLINYGVCVYVFSLMAVTYTCIFFYDRGYGPIHCFFRPIQKCVDRIHSPWNIEGTLIDVFITMVVLMYWRVTMVTMAILQPTEAYDTNGRSLGYRHYFEASRSFFNTGDHLEIVSTVLAVVVLGILVFHPIVLACYQFRSVHTFLNVCSCRRARLFHLYTKTLADTLQRSFKDGTNGTRDYRFFASFYFLIRLIGAYICLSQPLWSSPVLAILFLILLLLICCFQPHKVGMHNVLDALVYGLFVLINLLYTAIRLDWAISRDLYSTDDSTGVMMFSFKIIITIALTLPLGYLVLCILYQVVLKCRFVERKLKGGNNLELQGNSLQVDRDVDRSITIIDNTGHDAAVRVSIPNQSYRYGSVRL